jgi:hypothetical protein
MFMQLDNSPQDAVALPLGAESREVFPPPQQRRHDQAFPQPPHDRREIPMAELRVRSQGKAGGGPPSGTDWNDSERAAKAAMELFVGAINRLVAVSEKTSDTGTRLFFPGGIELIRLKFKVGSTAEISLTVAGAKAPPEPAIEPHAASSRAASSSPATSVQLG